MKVKEESEKVGWKLNIQKAKIMASSPITSWQTDREQWKQWETLFFSADGDCSHEIKRCLLLGRKTVTNLDSILKSKDNTLPTKVHLVKAMVFPVVMYGLWKLDYKESWVPKNWCFWSVLLEGILCFIRLGKKPSAGELTLLNCGIGKDSWESFGLQGDQSSQS